MLTIASEGQDFWFIKSDKVLYLLLRACFPVWACWCSFFCSWGYTTVCLIGFVQQTFQTFANNSNTNFNIFCVQTWKVAIRLEANGYYDKRFQSLHVSEAVIRSFDFCAMCTSLLLITEGIYLSLNSWKVFVSLLLFYCFALIHRSSWSLLAVVFCDVVSGSVGMSFNSVAMVFNLRYANALQRV